MFFCHSHIASRVTTTSLETKAAIEAGHAVRSEVRQPPKASSVLGTSAISSITFWRFS